MVFLSYAATAALKVSMTASVKVGDGESVRLLTEKLSTFRDVKRRTRLSIDEKKHRAQLQERAFHL